MAVVMVTGASGLIGRHVIAQLDPRVDLVCVSHSETDLLEPGAFVAALRRIQPTMVVHLAWSASGDPGYRTSPDNRQWQSVTIDAANYCARAGIRFVGVGTAIDEMAAGDTYATAKHVLRRTLAPLIEAGSVTWARPFYVFDPEARRPAVLAELLTAREHGRPALLREPYSRRDFVHVEDVATGMAEIVEQDLQGVVDVGSGRLRSVADLASATECDWVQDSAAPEDVVHTDRAADTAALRAAGWAPTSTMRFFSDE